MLLLFLACGAQDLIEPRRVYLAVPGDPEWEEFAGERAEGRRLDVRFRAAAGGEERTLYLRQRDVKLRWDVELNGRKLGELHLMEHPLVLALPVPPGALKDGENLLSILPPAGRDDVIVGDIRLGPPREAGLDVAVTDERGPVPCRITVADAEGALAPLAASPGQALAVRPGVAYTGDGKACLLLPAGRYTVTATRGFEYGLDRADVTLAAGETRRVVLSIRREVPTPGLVACDTHVHTFEYSGHGDISAAERMLTLAGEGIELPIATEHNRHASYAADAARAGMRRWFTPVDGNEVTTRKGHFNVFPVAPGAAVPDAREERWPELMESIRASGAQVVILNHPRDLHGKFRPFDPAHFNPVTGENRRGFAFSFDALEVINSGALQSDPYQLFRDWFALLNHGDRVAAAAGSDSHDAARYIVGQGRTYVEADDAEPGKIDVRQAVESFRRGRVRASLGLLTSLEREGGELKLSVLGPSWARADRAELFANGVKIREVEFGSGAEVKKFEARWPAPALKHDAWLVALASGPGVREPFWAIPKPYQPSSTAWVPRLLGSSAVLWIDGDGDGKLTAPRGYAKEVVARAGTEPRALVAALAGYDEAVAAQAASLCADLAAFDEALKGAPAPLRRGFAAVAATR